MSAIDGFFGKIDHGHKVAFWMLGISWLIISIKFSLEGLTLGHVVYNPTGVLIHGYKFSTITVGTYVEAVCGIVVTWHSRLAADGIKTKLSGGSQ